MEKKVFIILCFLIFTIKVSAQSISSRSSIHFEVINWSINTVEGSFGTISGEVTFDPDDLINAKFDISVPIKDIKTGIELRDNDLQAKKYFYSEKYPEAKFVSTSVRRKGNTIIVDGNLTIKGVSKKIEISFALSAIAEGYYLNARHTLDRYDFKVGDADDFKISREVKLQIELYLKT